MGKGKHTTFMSRCGADGSRRLVIDPAPLETFMMRGVPCDFASKCANATTVIAGPTTFVTNVAVS
jgi:hypothetical protein